MSADAPVTRPDLDALVGWLRRRADDLDRIATRSEEYVRREEREGRQEPSVNHLDNARRRDAETLRQASAALAAERARADQARAVAAEMADDDDEYPLEAWWRGRILRALSDDPAAERARANQVKADAWDEGAEFAVDGIDAPLYENPYRDAPTSEPSDQ